MLPFTTAYGSSDKSDTAQRLIDLEKIKHPGQPESWYLDKVVYDLKREA